ncbi:Amine oxidase [flavin-containing] [Cytospora mali]|uniref:Amine oxidase n=1 Tax=Cytospora mali TaxID=578113 RepID=A0A194VHK9_CYTMA|nr:Amine oxidase [flavin-containing] [Valsa mali]
MSKPIETVDLPNTSSAYFAPATLSYPETSLLHVAGQVGLAQDGHMPADYESQIHLALLNLKRVIFVAGASIDDLAKLTIYVVNYDPDTRKHIRHVKKFLNGHRPAITLVPVQQLAQPGWLFEVDAVVAVRTPGPLPMVSKSATKKVDVAIIGAGLAGLTAAGDVLRAGLSCVVLEARDRVGGKTWSQPLSKGDGTIDLGAAWINDTNQSRMIGLARRFGADLIEQNTTGDCVLQDFEGRCSSFPYGELPKFDADTARNVAEIRDVCEAHCQTLDVFNPQDTSLDSITFEAYLLSRGASKTALATATLWTRAMLGQEPSDISALFFLNYCKSGGGLMQMRSDRKHGGQYLRVAQGTQLFSKGLAEALPKGILQLSTPVASVQQTGYQGVEVQTTTGQTYSARKVISSVPSPVLRSISFSPPLPPAKRLMVESTTYGYYTKVMVVFKSPFWVHRGFCGLTQSFTGPASIIRDTSIPSQDKHVLTCFMVGEPGRSWACLSGAERENTLLQQIGTLFGSEGARKDFIEMMLYEWTGDEYAGWGCPCASLPPGVLDTVGETLREPVGDIHFVGTETAGEWKGYMEGAVRSGERGAAEVVSVLKETSSKL